MSLLHARIMAISAEWDLAKQISGKDDLPCSEAREVLENFQRQNAFPMPEPPPYAVEIFERHGL